MLQRFLTRRYLAVFFGTLLSAFLAYEFGLNELAQFLGCGLLFVIAWNLVYP